MPGTGRTRSAGAAPAARSRPPRPAAAAAAPAAPAGGAPRAARPTSSRTGVGTVHRRNEHAPIVPKTPGLRRYVQCHVAPETYGAGTPKYDGVAELCWADMASFEKGWQSDEMQVEQFNDVPNFVDIQNSVISYNTVLTRDGGSAGAGINGIENSTLTNVIIEYNKTIDGGGGGIIVGNPNPNTTLENVTIRYNYAIYGGGIAQLGSGQFIELSTGNKCNVYGNYATVGTDFYWQNPTDGNVTIELDTFTVTSATSFYAYTENGGNITIQSSNHVVDAQVGDVYVDPAGSNNNSGSSSASPIKNIYYALLSIYANSGLPGTIHLADGTYSPSTNGEFFPLGGKDFVSISGESQDGTILNGDSLTSIFYFEDQDRTIDNLTITNGYSSYSGGGIETYNDYTGNFPIITLNNLNIINNYSHLDTFPWITSSRGVWESTGV